MITLVFAIFCSLFVDPPPTKIACVGGSITYGAGMVNWEKNAYPHLLQEMLGGTYAVRNFGHNSRTVLSKGDLPYRKTATFKNALNYDPDLVFLMLGTHDSKIQHRQYLDEFEKDYLKLIKRFKKLKNNPRIILLLPPPSFHQDTTQIWEVVIRNRIVPIIQKIAFEQKLELLDLHPFFNGKPGLLPDKVHPSSLGASLIAQRLFEVVKTRIAKPVDLLTHFSAEEKKGGYNFHGYQGARINLNGIDCNIIQPKINVKGNPWMWRARFKEHLPQVEISLLERGFHIVYTDVPDLFGTAKAKGLEDEVYKKLIQAGLSQQIALQGIEKEGSIWYGNTIQKPHQVVKVYASFPETNEADTFEGKPFSCNPQDPISLVNFILEAAGQKINVASVATPGSEYRSAAGWREGCDWHCNNEEINHILDSLKKVDIIFLGNSITQGTGGVRQKVTYKPGFAAFQKAFSSYTWVNAGISGDRTQHILWRLKNGSYKKASPKVIVLTIGVNNFPHNSAKQISEGILKITTYIQTYFPGTRLIVSGVLPTGSKADSDQRRKYEKVHWYLSKTLDKTLYHPIGKDWILPSGELNPAYCSADGIHLVEGGYVAWAKELQQHIK
ncbi:GDSL-type esterase/lipase family protein [bacterium]|nr:GDSL-type esterase/lipase family protein [bacterium]